MWRRESDINGVDLGEAYLRLWGFKTNGVGIPIRKRLGRNPR